MSKKVTVYCGDEPWFRPYREEPGDMIYRCTDSEDFPNDSDCVLIPQEYAGERLVPMLHSLKNLLIPAAVAAFDTSVRNLDFLMDCGADEIITFPTPSRLLQKRLTALANNSVLPHTSVDFSVFDKIRESNQGRGSFVVQENDFTNIYRFVVRILERLEQKAQLIIFNFESDFGPFIESESVYHFIQIVQTCLRRGDISSICGKQVFVILMGADTAGGELVIRRIIDTFEAHYSDASCEITYQMREICTDRPS
jgi:hypothetical protein